MEQGEELDYTVYFGFIKLGSVKFRLNNVYTENKKKYYSAVADIKSFEGIPFIGIHFIFESVMLQEKNGLITTEFHSTEFKSSDAGGKMKINTDYFFDYDSNQIRIKKFTDPGSSIVMDTTASFTKGREYQDGLSIFYNARINSLQKSDSRRNVYVYINEKESSVKYSFNYNRDAISGDIADFDLAAIKVAGIAQFIGILGLTGEFEGWLSDDDFRVPYKARFNITIGSVTLELNSYKRAGWQPPKFND